MFDWLSLNAPRNYEIKAVSLLWVGASSFFPSLPVFSRPHFGLCGDKSDINKEKNLSFSFVRSSFFRVSIFGPSIVCWGCVAPPLTQSTHFGSSQYLLCDVEPYFIHCMTMVRLNLLPMKAWHLFLLFKKEIFLLFTKFFLCIKFYLIDHFRNKLPKHTSLAMYLIFLGWRKWRS